MSDQQSSSPPPKPKPGSLRDRIAAFEKSASVAAPEVAPAPRPKPAGFASWKPKAPSPPSSPSIDNAAVSPPSKASGTMSASDAKESITKGGGGSLKDRMAALQGKGAFGAPAPPLAPKPATVKPKWKPPPAVAPPVDDDDHDSAGITTSDEPPIAINAATADRTKSPPISIKSRGSLDLSGPIPEEASAAEPATSNEATTDPEEEERQRRAAIAARMARLGGARLGMAPPVLARKPPAPARKPTREDVPKEEDREEVPKRESLSLEEKEKTIEGNISPTANEGATVTSQPTLTDSPHVQEPEYLPIRKNSENASLLSVDSTDSNTTRSLSSMPVPTVPRRAGPPRKKHMKPPPEVPEVSEERVEEVTATPATIATLDEFEQKAVKEAEQEAIEAPEHESLDHGEISIQGGEIHDEPQSIDLDIQHELVEGSTSRGESKELEFTHDVQSPPLATISSDELEQEREREHEHVDIDDLDQLEHVATNLEDRVQDDEFEDEITDHSDERKYEETHEAEHHEHRQDEDHHVDVSVDTEPQPPSLLGVTGTEEHDDDDEAAEEARRKRVAERLAKMGGVNPFAPPPLRRSSEDTGYVSSPVVSTHASSPSVVLPTSPPRPDVPSRKASLRSSHEVAEPQKLPIVESKVEEKGEAEYSDEIEGEDHEKLMEESSLPPIPGSPPRLPDPSISHEEAPLPPARPAQPPRRIVPQAPEELEHEEEEEGTETDDEGVPSHLFVRPVSQHPVRGAQRYEAGEDEDEDGDGSENDAPALPVLQRRSAEVPLGRSLPPPPPPPLPPTVSPHLRLRHRHLSAPPSDVSEPDSDHDGQALPIRPRHIAVPPTPPTPVQAPLATPRRSVPSIPANEELFSSYEMPSVAVSEPEEVLDEEEGDPIDPAFHSPSRRSSMLNMHGSATSDTSEVPVQVPSPTTPVVGEPKEVQQQEQNETKRQTIAERMARLGGIKFGAAPIPASVSRPPPRAPQEEQDEGGHPQADAEDIEQSVESEEEEERARKERIAAKLAGMGGMRIGMMPMGMGSLPQKAHVSKDENAPPLSPTHTVLPPVRPPPPVRPQIQDTDSERISDDGIKVEAEESDMEEVNYEDAVEEIEETIPPIPPRAGRAAHRSESSDKAIFSPPLPIPVSRPPVPVSSSARRSSVQTSKSTGSVDFGTSPSRATSSHVYPQSEYVMVDEPQSIDEPPPTPSRHTSRAPPVRPPPIPVTIPQTSDPNNISSQWELPSIPTLDFGNNADLSLSSWTDAGEPTSPPLPSKQPTVLPPKPKPSELQLSTDDLMAMWGRVGVQVCEVATSLFDKSKKTLVGDGTFAGFITAVLAGVPNAAPISFASGEYGYLVYAQNGSSVQKRVSEIMPGDIVEIHEGKLKGHKGIHMYHQNVGSGEVLLGIVGEFEAKKSKIRVFHANQHVGQQTVESVSYRLEDLKSGTVKVYRVLEFEG